MIRILIVDDEYIMRQGLNYMIQWEEEGYQIVGEAANGEEALTMIKELKPHIIICDVVMPVMNGTDFAETVHQLYPQIPIIIISGFDKFDYVKQAFLSGVCDYILKPSLNPEVVRKALDKAVDRLPDHVKQLRKRSVSRERLLERYIMGMDQALDIGEVQKTFRESYFRLFVLDIGKAGNDGRKLSDVLVKKLDHETDKMDTVTAVTIFLKETQLCAVFCYPFTAGRKVKRGIPEITEKLSVICADIFAVCSSEFRNVEQLRDTYLQEIVPNIENRFYYPGSTLLWAEDSLKEERVKRVEKFDFIRYSLFLEKRQYAEAIELLCSYNKSALEAHTDETRLKNQIKNMIYCFLDALDIDDETKEDYQRECFICIEEAASSIVYKETIDSIKGRLLELTGMIPCQNDERIRKILNYIDENYMQDIHLENLAEQFNFNYSYLSAYFNQQVKEGFNDYLNRVRISKACELLRSGNEAVSRISQEVGYSEHSYFCRVFRKITGKTPSEWRRS